MIRRSSNNQHGDSEIDRFGFKPKIPMPLQPEIVKMPQMQAVPQVNIPAPTPIMPQMQMPQMQMPQMQMPQMQMPQMQMPQMHMPPAEELSPMGCFQQPCGTFPYMNMPTNMPMMPMNMMCNMPFNQPMGMMNQMCQQPPIYMVYPYMMPSKNQLDNICECRTD